MSSQGQSGKGRVNGCVVGIVLLLAVSQSVASTDDNPSTPGLDEIWQLVQQQQSRIGALEKELQGSQRRLEEAQTRLQAGSQEQDSRIAKTETTLHAAVDAMEASVFSDGVSANGFGGYGEMHYSNLDSGDRIDLHRFVLFYSHQFNQKLSFYSELEVEHNVAGEGKPGEVEVEQAFIQWDYADNHRAKIGVFLLPVGLLNETHEPDTFYGVERNSVEKQIIPATWWEGGFAFDGEIAPGWGYDVALRSGLALGANGSIRSARQKVASGYADALAYTARLRYSGVPGFSWSASLQYQSDLTQDDLHNIGIDEVDATLFETSLSLQRAGFGLRALYARWDIGDEIELLNPGSDEQQGWYVEPSYRFDSFGVFLRYSSYDLTAGSKVTQNEKNQLDLGINYWLSETVVLKADLQRQDNDNGNDIDGFNLGVGYSF